MNLKHPRIYLPVVALASLLLSPASGFAQVLLTASEFTLLAGTAVSVSGGGGSFANGHVHGDTGTTGFPPGMVSGTTLSGAAAAVIPANTGATIQAQLDRNTAHIALASLVAPPANNFSGVPLGTGMAALAPGVYQFNVAAFQNGAVILDAQGMNGVAWVFNIGTDLTTAALSSVSIINYGSNGGSDLGLFWNAGGSITIGDQNIVLGNYLAGAGISFTGITSTNAVGGFRALAGTAVSFAGSGVIGDARGGPGGGDMDGGLMYDGLGQLVPIPPPVIPPVPTGNVLLSTTGAFVAGASGVTLVPGTEYPTTTLTIDGNASNGSAPASLTINTATVTLTGTNTYTAGTFVNNGTLIASAANLPVNQAVALNTSTLNFSQAADGIFGGVISGNGAVVKIGAATLTLTAANTYTGGTTISAGTLVGSTSTLPLNRDIAIAGNGFVVFNQNANGTFGGNLTGSGTLVKTGSSSLTLARATPVTIDHKAGALYFTGGLGRTTVASGAFLGGTGTITGNLLNHGTVSPGTSPGTINVTGNYTQSATGRLIVEVASATSFDKVIATGTAALAGTLQVDVQSGYNPVGQSFTFLNAAGGVSGTFGTLAFSGPGSTGVAISKTVTYAPTSATLAFAQIPFSTFAETPNQVAVADGAQGSPAITTVLNTIQTAGEFPPALNALSPQGYQIWSDVAFAHGTALADRLSRSQRPLHNHDNLYFDVSQRRGRTRRDADVGMTTSTSTAQLVGMDRVVDANVAVGGFYEHNKTVSGLGSVGSHTTIRENMLGLRSVWGSGPLFAHAVIGYGFDKYKSSRSVALAGTSTVATSSTRGHQWIAGISGGQNFKAGILTVSPFVGVLASRWKADGFTETGAGAYSNVVGAQSARSLRSEAGLGAALDWQVGGLSLAPYVRAAWLHEFSNKSRAIHGTFDSSSYAVATHRPQRDSARLSAGLNVMLSPRALLYGDYSAQNGGITKILSEWRVGLVINF